MLMAIGYFKKKIKARHQEFLAERDREKSEQLKKEQERREARKVKVHPKNQVQYWKSWEE